MHHSTRNTYFYRSNCKGAVDLFAAEVNLMKIAIANFKMGNQWTKNEIEAMKRCRERGRERSHREQNGNTITNYELSSNFVFRSAAKRFFLFDFDFDSPLNVIIWLLLTKWNSIYVHPLRLSRSLRIHATLCCWFWFLLSFVCFLLFQNRE